MKPVKQKIHFIDNYLLAPTNPVIVNLIGAGGTGSQMLTALARINCSLIALGHPGISVTLFDDDLVTSANLGRQLFITGEIGQAKAAALINRVNRFFGTNWKSQCQKITAKSPADSLRGNITITCVDSVKARKEVATLLRKIDGRQQSRNRPIYWMDFGNSRHTGQVVLSTVATVKQPTSKKYEAVNALPFITQEFKSLLASSKEDDTPSCSMAEALAKQDLFINTSLCALGASLLWSMFREGMIQYRGFFLNLKDFRTQPISVS